LEPGQSRDPRFGVVMTGGLDKLSTSKVTAALDALGATSWYTFDGSVGVTPGQVGLVRPGTDMDRLAALARAAPGSAWLIGNEPNVPGQDNMDPARYVEFLRRVSTTLREVDPSAILVGPNVLNWDVTCTGCPGF